MTEDRAKLIAAEEAKRNRVVSREERRRMIEAGLKQIGRELMGIRNTKEVCLAKQARIMAGLKAASEPK